MTALCGFLGFVVLCITSQLCAGRSTLLPQKVRQQAEQQSFISDVKDPLPQSDSLQKCSVEEQDKVHCGEPGISLQNCEAINCCFDGRQCYYGNAVTIQCTRDGQFVIVITRNATVPRVSLDSISLLGGSDPPCGPVGSTAAFAIYQFPVIACGTTVTMDGDYVVYENRMISAFEVNVGPQGSITRDSHFELVFQCRYSGTSVEALVVEVDPVPAPLPVTGSGPLRVELRLANGQCFAKGCVEEDHAFNSYYSETEYPVTKVLREPVYVEVHILDRTDPNIVLMLGRCWATSNPDPQSQPQWDVLLNGCPNKDDHYQTTLVPVDSSSGMQFPTHYKRFMLKMFTFVDSTATPTMERVFLHCSVTVCTPTATDSCIQSCSRTKRAVQTGIDASLTISSGEIFFVQRTV